MKYLLCVLCATLAACGDYNTLGGSLQGQYSLKFDEVKIYWNGPHLSILYENPVDIPRGTQGLGGRINNQIFRLTLDSVAPPLQAGQDIPLVGNVDAPTGHAERYVVSMQPQGGLVQEPPLPDLVGGTVHFDKLSRKIGDTVRGHFDGDFADGRAVFGQFEAPVVRP